MSTRIDYGQIVAKLDYPALDRKLQQLLDRRPPKKHKTAADVLEPLRERLLALHHQGWSSGQLAEELKTAGVPVSPAHLRDCLRRWSAGGDGTVQPRPRRRLKRSTAHPPPTIPASPAGRSNDSQTGLRLPER
jgi:hypothetical protein